MYKSLFITILTMLLITSIGYTQQGDIQKGKYVLDQCLKAHGGNKYNKAHYQFVFRKKVYTFKNKKSNYSYTVENKDNGSTTKDVFSNKAPLVRTTNGQIENLSDKKRDGIREGLNSVIYFATLPHKLTDEAVNVSHIGVSSIKGQSYEILRVTFDKAGGGKDHQDVYHYWINQNTKQIDYLAYNYIVGKGGVRFRSAYNKRVVDGILFQDYINYKAPVGTPLELLPMMYEKGELTELSRIETESVIKL